MGKTCRPHWEIRYVYKIFVRKPEEMREKCGWKENIKMEFKKNVIADWISL